VWHRSRRARCGRRIASTSRHPCRSRTNQTQHVLDGQAVEHELGFTEFATLFEKAA
jgi:hypothetical protein